MYKSSGILAAQKFLSTAENDTRFYGYAFSTIVQLTKRCCLQYGVGQGVAVTENCGNVGSFHHRLDSMILQSRRSFVKSMIMQ
jgi:hypothetical protein